MRDVLLWTGRLAGAGGVLLTGVAAIARLSGSSSLGSFEALTLLEAGTAAMVLACLSYLATLAERP